MTGKILSILAILAATILQISLFSVIPFLNKINIVLFIILYLSTKKTNFFIPMAIFGGVMLDFYSSFIFGTHLITMLASASLINYAYFKIFVGHRFFSFIILMNAGVFFYHILLWVVIVTLDFLKIYARADVLELNFSDILKEAAVLTFALSASHLAFKIFENKVKIIFIPAKN